MALPGGLTALPGDVVRFDGATYTLEFDAAGSGLPNGVITDAVGKVEGDLLLSFDVTVDLGGFNADDEDLVRFDGVGFSLFLDGSAARLPEELDVDGAHWRALHKVMPILRSLRVGPSRRLFLARWKKPGFHRSQAWIRGGHSPVVDGG